ncbi:hypothetical protein [Halorubrum sp. AJ67]|uniref:hypothetical protein n=1 Tax=Halorubrum sp. AJ67 TaxID=1173487 RepID=UPI0003DC964F|nr:hypothetical protein [Halorubrum sp. AJ67]CDK38197.1 putative signal peptide protein [Halorubrum sp. AJ67]
MPPTQATNKPRSPTHRLFTLSLIILVTSSVLVGTVSPALAAAQFSPETTEATTAISSDTPSHPPLSNSDSAVNSKAVVVNEDGNIVSGQHVSYGEPQGRLIREYTVNGLEKSEPLEISGNTIRSSSGHRIVVDGEGVVRVFEESPIVRARYENGTVEKLIANGSNIETASGNNIVTSDGENIGVDRGAFTESKFAAEILSTGQVGEGSILNVTAKIRNVGHVTEQKRIGLVVDDREYNSKLLRLEPGESDKVKLRYRTRPGDAPEIELAVKTPDAKQVTTVEVAKPRFRLDVPKTSLAVAAGETISVPFEVARTGGTSEDTYATDLVINGTVVDTKLITLRPESSDSTTFSYETTEDDTPSVRATVVGPNNTNITFEIPVQKPILGVNQIVTPENVTEYESTNATATLENFGTTKKNQTVQLIATHNHTGKETTIAEKQVTLANRSTKTVTFGYHTDPEYHPWHSLIVRTEDDEKIYNSSSLPASVFQISPAPARNQTSEAGSQHTLSPVIENIGHKQGIANITHRVNGTVEKTQNLSIPAGGSVSSELNITTPANGTVTYETTTQHDAINGSVTVGNTTDAADTPTEQSKTAAGQAVVEKSGGLLSGISLPSLPVVIGVVICCLVVFLIAQLAV